jgi:cytochrome c6
LKRILLAVVAAALFAVPAAAADKKIERLYKSKCQSCHGADGKAQTEKGKKMKMLDLTTAEWQAKNDDAAIIKAIKEGSKSEKDGVKKEMDPYDDLDEEQVKGLVAFIRELKK